jgi:hypothetical protein
MKYTILTSLCLALCLMGCKKEETTPTPQPATDTRDQSVGTYSGTFKTYNPTDVLVSTDPIAVKVSKNSANNSRIDAYDPTDPTALVFYGINIKAAGTAGFGFDAPKQLEDLDGYVIGYKKNTIAATMYDGTYTAATKKLVVSFKLYDLSNVYLGYVDFELTKQ